MAAVTVWLGVWGTGKEMLPGELEAEKEVLSFSMWLSEGQGWDIWGRAGSGRVSAITRKHRCPSLVDRDQDQ